MNIVVASDAFQDEKYVVFRREEFDEFLGAVMEFGEQRCCDLPVLPEIISDATVIRSQDIFAGPVLHTYSSMIGTVAPMVDNDDIRRRLFAIADLFHRRAIEADDMITKKLPD